jgi:hypothetical protein
VRLRREGEVPDGRMGMGSAGRNDPDGGVGWVERVRKGGRRRRFAARTGILEGNEDAFERGTFDFCLQTSHVV